MKMMAQEEFLPIVDKYGTVVGKIARSVSMSSSKTKEMHPVVRVHFIIGDYSCLFKRAGEDTWDCAINEHVLFGELMDQTITRAARELYGIEDFSPRFLLKHIDEFPHEKQFILLYYVPLITDITLLNSEVGEFKCWPLWQIEENLGMGIFSKTFESEFDYLENTILMVNREDDIAKDLVEKRNGIHTGKV